MHTLAMSLVVAAAVGVSAITPAAAACVSDIAQARAVIDTLPESRHKQMAERQLRQAMARQGTGEDGECLITLTLSVAPPDNNPYETRPTRDVAAVTGHCL